LSMARDTLYSSSCSRRCRDTSLTPAAKRGGEIDAPVCARFRVGAAAAATNVTSGMKGGAVLYGYDSKNVTTA
jgi:hypothetical protein